MQTFPLLFLCCHALCCQHSQIAWKHNSSFQHRIKTSPFMCKIVWLMLSMLWMCAVLVNVCESGHVQQVAISRSFQRLLHNKAVDGVAQITAVHLRWQTVGAEQILSRFTVEDWNIILAWQGIWRINSYVWNGSEWIWSMWMNPAKYNNKHYNRGSEPLCPQKMGACKSLPLSSCS